MQQNMCFDGLPDSTGRSFDSPRRNGRFVARIEFAWAQLLSHTFVEVSFLTPSLHRPASGGPKGFMQPSKGAPDGAMAVYESFRDLLFKLDPETAHGLTIKALHPLPAPKRLPRFDEKLSINVAGIPFPTPIGLAAGFDKDAKAPGRMLGFGFGFVEVGTVTPLPQPGNPGRRLFRLLEDQAIINRFGFNSEGHDAVFRRLKRRVDKPGVVGLNLGANKASEDRVGDYVLGVRRFAKLVDYLTINVSSPNTSGLRDLQSPEHLPALIDRVLEARQETGGPPIFLKVSPDLPIEAIRQVARDCLRGGVEALIVGNTTVSRPTSLRSPAKSEIGGLSGPPLKEIALQSLRAFRSEVGTALPLVGVGGISTADDVYERLKAGASLVQFYTALAYSGPGLVNRMNQGLSKLLEADGLSAVAQAIGLDAPHHRESAAA
jgi:dihydroorotate dehydrogenase